jgi:pimeloyl-ACP methyl ester carboxylesterase
MANHASLRHALLSLLCTASLIGCGSSGGDATPSPTDTGPGDAGGKDAAPDDAEGGADAPGAIVWTPCPTITDGTGLDAFCTEVMVPLRPEAPDGEQIPIFVKRVPAKAKARIALWLLAGGPGFSGQLNEQSAVALSESAGADVYLPDHRGTGRSSRLGCTTSEGPKSIGGSGIMPNEWRKCAEDAKAAWGDRLLAFTTTNAAKDLGLLIDGLRVPGQPVFVHGGSYGTYWAHRYLQVRPDQADGVILDSIAPPGMTFTDYDSNFDKVGKQLAAACAADAFCSGKMGPDPWARIGATLAKLDAGHCPELAAKAPARLLLRNAAGNALWDGVFRPMILVAAYRAERCNAADIKALTTLFDKLFFTPKPPQPLTLYAPVLSTVIGLSELWKTPSPTLAELQAITDAAYVSRDLGPYMGAAYPYFPRYEPDAYVGKFATTSVPLLMMNGTLDPATPIEGVLPFAEHYKGEHQQLVVFPGATHGVMQSSWTNETPSRSCGRVVLESFLADPKKPVDQSCIAAIPPVAFTIPADKSTALLGIADVWED